MKLFELVKQRGVYLDPPDLEQLKNYSAYLDDQGRVILCLGSREAGEVFLPRYLVPGFDTVDHRDGNPGNNRRYNLRGATRTQNQGNRKLNNNNISGYKGVRKSGKKWAARITVNGKEVSLGSYFSIHIAAEAYNIAALNHFGEFAKLNEIKNETK